MAAKRTRIEPEPISITPPQKINLFEGIDLNALSAALSPPSPSEPPITPETAAPKGPLPAGSHASSDLPPEPSIEEDPREPTTPKAVLKRSASTRSSAPKSPGLSAPKSKRQASVRQPSKAAKQFAPNVDLLDIEHAHLILTEIQLKTLSYLIKVSESSLNFTNSTLISNAVGSTPLGIKDTLRRLRNRGIVRTKKDTLEGGIQGFWVELDSIIVNQIRLLYNL